LLETVALLIIPTNETLGCNFLLFSQQTRNANKGKKLKFAARFN